MTTQHDLERLIAQLTLATHFGQMDKAKMMVKAARFQLFGEVTDDHVAGIVKSQVSPSLFYVCKIDKDGNFLCGTQNLNRCGGLRGKLCKHLLVLMIGLVQSGAADAAVLTGWVKNVRPAKLKLDRDAMSAIIMKYEAAKAGAEEPPPAGGEG